MFGRNGIDPKKIIPNCKPSDEDGILVCKPMLQTPDGPVPMGQGGEVKLERIGPKAWRILNDGGCTVEELKALEKALTETSLR